MSLLRLKIPATILHSLADGTTVFRLYVRIRCRAFWWDDGWALLALIFDILYCVSFWLDETDLVRAQHRVVPIVFAWVSNLLAPSVLWAARMSILASIKRIVQPWVILRRITMAVAISFGFMWVILLAEKIWICAPKSSGIYRSDACMVKQVITDTDIAFYAAADLLLFAVPLRMVWGVRLPPDAKRVMICIFAISICTTLSNVVHVVFLLLVNSHWGVYISFTGHLQSATFLSFCNLLVIAPIVYRQIMACYGRLGREEGREDTDDYFNFTSYWGSAPLISSSGALGTEDELGGVKD